MDWPSAIYQEKVEQGIFREDDAQRKVVALFDQLYQELLNYHPPSLSSNTGLINKVKKFWQKPIQVPKGIYLEGKVGRGKSMLMDLFYNHMFIEKKLRIHFHQFMQQVYIDFHESKRKYPQISDPIPPLASKLASNAWLLCFDEFQINDIADALLLGRLFEQLFERGVVIIATSNVPIAGLFQNRPGADAFKPFIQILKAHMMEIKLDSNQDYRLNREEDEKRWLFPCNEEHRRYLNYIFDRESHGLPIQEKTLIVMGRSFNVSCTAGKVARFTFSGLCDANLGAGDYLALAQNFQTLIVDDIPEFNPEERNIIDRFVMLIDVLYEQHVKLYATASVNYNDIYRKNTGNLLCERTISRLNEMQDKNWGYSS